MEIIDKKNCEECKDLPEGEVIQGHDHRTIKPISKETWGKFVAGNSENSYSLAVCLAILELWEHKVTTREEAHKVLGTLAVVKGFSGAQAHMAISYALGGEPEGWLDQTMVDISTKKEI